MGYILVGLLFLLAAAASFAWTALRRHEPDADTLALPSATEPSATETTRGLRMKHLFSCYLAGNDAFPSTYCPYDECTPERAEWIAGWTLAAKGIMVDGREGRRKRNNADC